jgi:uncharacterized protein with PQ loop repeat
MSQLISNILTSLCVFCYIVLYIPQIYNIYKLKTSDNISLETMIILSISNTLNIISIIFLNIQLSLLIIGIVCLIMNYILYIVILVYKRVNKSKNIKIFSSIFFLQILSCIFISVYNSYINDSLKIILGYIFTLLSALTFFGSKIPQIYKNFKNRVIYEISLNMFIFSIIGNIFFILSIITFSLEPEYIYKNISWLVSTCITILLDSILVLQWFYYKI